MVMHQQWHIALLATRTFYISNEDLTSEPVQCEFHDL